MGSGDADPLPLPHTWRPRLARVVAYGLALVLLVLPVVLWVLLPQDVRSAWNAPQIATVAGFILAGVAILHLVVRGSVRADEDGVTVVTMVRTHRVPWERIRRVRMAPGDPWAYLDLSDGTALALMGIQASDGDRARRAAAELAGALARHSPESRGPTN